MGSERWGKPLLPLYARAHTHTHVTDSGTAHCLSPDIRTRHNDNDDAPVFFFSIHNNNNIRTR